MRPAVRRLLWIAGARRNRHTGLLRQPLHERRRVARPDDRDAHVVRLALPISDAVESLNVSNAAAVALYAASVA